MGTKQEIYDRICKLLEDSQNEEYATIQEEAGDMFEILVSLRDNFASLFGK